MSQGQYVATRPFPTTHRQYEIGDMIDISRITSSELNAGVTSGAIEPAKFIDTAARLAALNPVLGPGVHAYETDTGVHKIGTDGVTRYNSLDQVGKGTYARSGDPLRRWRSKLGTDPANAKLVICGDSTSDAATSAASIYTRLRALHADLPGGALYGMTSGNIISGGNNGLSLTNWFANPAGAYPYNRDALLAATPDLIVYSWLFNDVRLGALGTTVDAVYTTGRALLVQLIEWTIANLPNTDILLRMPNPMLSSNVSSLNLVSDGTTVNAAGIAQVYTTALRRIYLSLVGQWPTVGVADTQGELFGTVSTASHPLMADQLHPSPTGSTTGGIPNSGGYVAIADYLASKIGVSQGAYPATRSNLSARTAYDVYIVAGGSAFCDLAVRGLGPSAAQFPITTADSLWVPGLDSPISLSGKSISRPFGTTNIRITGLTGLDFTSLVGRPAVVTSSNPGPTTGDRQVVSVDLPSVSAGAIATTTATVTGVRTGALHDATAVVASPPAAFVSGGLVLLGAYPSANDTVTVVVQNPTGSPVDLAAANWAFWVVR